MLIFFCLHDVFGALLHRLLMLMLHRLHCLLLFFYMRFPLLLLDYALLLLLI